MSKIVTITMDGHLRACYSLERPGVGNVKKALLDCLSDLTEPRVKFTSAHLHELKIQGKVKVAYSSKVTVPVLRTIMDGYDPIVTNTGRTRQVRQHEVLIVNLLKLNEIR